MPHSKAQTTTLTANSAHARREKKENNGADPFQFKKFHAHIAHEGKEIAEKAYDLPRRSSPPADPKLSRQQSPK